MNSNPLGYSLPPGPHFVSSPVDFYPKVATKSDAAARSPMRELLFEAQVKLCFRVCLKSSMSRNRHCTGICHGRPVVFRNLVIDRSVNMLRGRMFQRYIGIDYSGEDERTRRPRGLAVCCAVGNQEPRVVLTWVQGAKYWRRSEIATWLVERLKETCIPTLIGIDHGFSFPIDYFDYYDLPTKEWVYFLEDFEGYWSIGDDYPTVTSRWVKQQTLKRIGQPEGHRLGEKDWFRLTDRFSRASSSHFDFEAMAEGVAHSTHAGLPWLLSIRQQLGDTLDEVNFWPFTRTGWDISPGQSAVVEVYPALWNRRFEQVYTDKGGHKYDAYSVAKWMSETDRNGHLEQYFRPRLTYEQTNLAETEGWIFGVLGNGRTEPR